jgi:hypothetical protein
VKPLPPPPFLLASGLLLALLAGSGASAAPPSIRPNSWTALKATGDGPLWGTDTYAFRYEPKK